jgi:beta-glucosidase
MAAVDGLTHSTDVECGNSVYPTLLDAVKTGLLNENEIDVSLRRLFVIRLRLGQFDPPNIMPYSNTSDTLLECEAHKALALKIAQQSIVLLKNENNVLPLKKDIKKIAVIGPNADNPLTQLANYNGFPSEIVTVLEGIKEKLGSNVEIIYDKAINYTDDSLFIYSENDIFFYQRDKKVKADFFNNTILEGKPVLTTFKNRIDDFWVEGQQPENGIKGTYFSVRYTTYYKSPSTETTTFIAEGDNGYKIFLNDNLVCDAWDNGKKEPQSFQTEMKKDTIYKIVIEYYQGDGFGRMKFGKGIKIKTDFNALKNKLKDVDVIVFVGGISAELEGEEMPVKYPGFDGGDRTKIELPEVQTKLMKSLNEIGKPVVFVMMTGSAISCNWENENIPAILNVWYGGQSAGTAVADVLFGDYNPAGRLPVTFYKSTSDLPDFKDYSMLNRTYRYFNGTVLYPFGYGLSYTQFEYTNLKLSNYEITKNGTVTILVNVKNTGNYDGDEVVQLYLKNKTSLQPQPIKSLRAFKRIGIKKGENITLDFVLSADDFKYFNEQLNDFVIDPGIYEIQIGASSADIRLHTDIQIKP